MAPRGRWLNDPMMHLLPGTRNVELPENLGYIDRRGQKHITPRGTRSDGMTSVAWAWGLIGCPLTPEYRRPCAQHDHQVRERILPDRYVHQLLRESLEEARDGRLWKARVWLFYWLVMMFGPRW